MQTKFKLTCKILNPIAIDILFIIFAHTSHFTYIYNQTHTHTQVLIKGSNLFCPGLSLLEKLLLFSKIIIESSQTKFELICKILNPIAIDIPFYGMLTLNFLYRQKNLMIDVANTRKYRKIDDIREYVSFT